MLGTGNEVLVKLQSPEVYMVIDQMAQYFYNVKNKPSIIMSKAS